jgi:hypothetical protein
MKEMMPLLMQKGTITKQDITPDQKSFKIKGPASSGAFFMP